MSASTNYPTIRPSLLLDFANTEQLDPRITFARSTTATYYDDNTVAKAEENLLTYSQDFSNTAWSAAATGITRTANATTAPDGTNTASAVTGNGATSVHYFGQNFTYSSTATYAFSVYVKANGVNYIQIILSDGTGYANFNVTSGAGAVGTYSAAFSNLAIQDVGNGWYRCSCLIVNNNYANIYICLSDAANKVRADVSFATSGGVYLWGAQLEQRSTVTAYTPTTSAPITNYIPVLMTAAINEARLDHNPTTRESLGLLIEESRTNLIAYSEQVSGVWSGINVTATNDVVVSPGGTVTGDIVVANTSNAQHRIEYTSAFTSGTAYTLSVYAKAGGYNYVWLRTANDQVNVFFNLSNGTVSILNSGSASITPVGNGWYRCTATGTANATGNAVSRINVSNGQDIFAGDGWSGIYLWGMQLEAASFATSYIPTVASQVTRSADSASMTGSNFSSWYSGSYGSIYVEAMQTTMFASSRTAIALRDSSTGNGFNIYRQSAGYANAYIRPDLTVMNPSVATSAGVYWKGGFSYGDHAASFVANASSAATATETDTITTSINSLEIGGLVSGSAEIFNGYLKRIAYYPARLTNAQLQAITS